MEVVYPVIAGVEVTHDVLGDVFDVQERPILLAAEYAYAIVEAGLDRQHVDHEIQANSGEEITDAEQRSETKNKGVPVPEVGFGVELGGGVERQRINW